MTRLKRGKKRKQVDPNAIGVACLVHLVNDLTARNTLNISFSRWLESHWNVITIWTASTST